MSTAIKKFSAGILLSGLVLGLVINLPTAPAAQAYTAPQLPAVYVNSDYPTLPSNRTIRSVKTSCGGVLNCYTDLQVAIDEAILGDEIVLDAGMTVTGSFVLRNKTGSDWIVIRSSALSSLPSGVRVGPGNASLMAKIMAPGANDTAIRTEASAHHYRLAGLEISKQVSGSLVTLIELGSSTATSTAGLANNIILDRVWAHGDATTNMRRCVALHGSHVAVIDSYVSDCHEEGSDAQAIAGWNGPGPYKIVNNYLEGSGENVMFGGSIPAFVGVISEDIEFRGNLVSKPLSWKTGNLWTNKNLFELKSARRVLIDGNVFENSWTDGQTGTGIIFKSNNPGGGSCTYCETAHVTFTNNIVRNVEEGLTVNAAEGGNDTNNPVLANNILVKNNLFVGVTRRLFLISNGVIRMTIDHNTGLGPDLIMLGGDEDIFNPNFEMTNNILQRRIYGIGVGADEGIVTLGEKFTPYTFRNNLFANGSSVSNSTVTARYPAGSVTQVVTGLDGVGFVNHSAGDYRLAGASSFKNAGTDGLDLGANIDAINAAITAGQNGAPPPAPSLPPPPPPPPADQIEVIVDNLDSDKVSITGVWSTSTFESGYYASNYIHDANADKGTKLVRFTPTIVEPGTYEIFMRWSPKGDRSNSVPVSVAHASGIASYTVNQQLGTSQWNLIGSQIFNAGTSGYLEIGTGGTTGYVVADAVRFVTTLAVTPPPPGPTPSPQPGPDPVPPPPGPTPSPQPGPGTSPLLPSPDSYPSGTIFKYPDNPTVYIKEGIVARPITDWTVYQNNVPPTRPIVTIPNTVTFNAGNNLGLRSGSLVRTISDPTVYLIVNDQKRPFFSEAEFRDNNYSFDQVYVINDPNLIASIPMTEEPFQRPIRTLFKYLNDPTVYFLNNARLKRPFTTYNMFRLWVDDPKNVIIVPETEVYPDGAPVTLPNGLLVKGASDTVYLTDGDILRPISNQELFLAMGFSFDQVITILDSDLSLHATGEPVQ